jgi:rubrerythrin
MMERPPLLSTEPRGGIADLEALLGLANAVEEEAVTRYAQLAGLMEQRGDQATAAVFHEMCEIERRHVEMVAGLADSLQRPVPPAAGFAWHLPPDIAESWDAVQHSALLTPYRALAIAVTNEERTFALYSYIAAHADDPAVARQAEALAREELAHAAELRVRRRIAYHREVPGGTRPAAAPVESLADFRDLDARLMRQAAEVHRAVASALEAAGDGESARLVAALAQREGRIAGGDGAAAIARPAGQPAALLQEALRPLEAASERYENLITAATQEDLLRAAQAALQRVVEAIAALGARLHRLSEHPDGVLR